MDVTYLSHCPAARQWQQIGIKTHHGINIPLFSIHSSHSNGIGEFTDLPLLIDWCRSIGFDIIQLLPLNDTGANTSPYSARSAFALNPIHLGLSFLPYLNEIPSLQEELHTLPRFSTSHRLEYSAVRENKKQFLRRYFDIVGPKILSSQDYRQFIESTAYWLKGYAVFKMLKNKNDGKSWEDWPEAERSPSPAMIEQIAAQNSAEINWYCMQQFLCDQQMKQAKKYAEDKGVFLMGDIPILIDRDSADVWQHRELFNLNYSAGSPPDMYSQDGQNWGFPTYLWEAIESSGFHWWKERLRWSTRYYHLYRIDHIVGFFRIWSIPPGHKGKEGHFIPEDERIWIDHGQKIMLMMLEASDMLPIGEDLGVVPPEVRTCLSALGICGTRVMRWERKWREDSRFILPEDYLLDTMTTVSTHDSETLQQWWQRSPEEAQLFARFKGWTYQSVLSRDHHREILWDSHHTGSLFHINLLQEYLSLVPGLSSDDPEDERINTPGVVSERNWSYRMKPSLEELASQTTLQSVMRELIL